MGCWNEVCQITGLTITCVDEPAVVFVLKKNTDSVSLGYNPVGFPIIGEYDDYGCIENVDPTKYTDMLLEYINPLIDRDGDTHEHNQVNTIENMIHHIERGHVKDHYLFWCHKSAYDLLVKIGANGEIYSDHANFKSFLLDSIEELVIYLRSKNKKYEMTRLMKFLILREKLEPFKRTREDFHGNSLINLNDLYEIKEEQIEDLVIDLNQYTDMLCFIRGMDVLQKQFIPKLTCGTQEHNGEEVMALYGIAKSIFDKRKAEYEEEWEDDC